MYDLYKEKYLTENISMLNLHTTGIYSITTSTSLSMYPKQIVVKSAKK